MQSPEGRQARVRVAVGDADMRRLERSEAQNDALAATRSPHLDDYTLSLTRRNGQRPHGLVALLQWYERECWMAIPEALHKRELWHEYVKVTDDAGSYAKQGGGSVLGTPAYNDAFRQLLEAPRSVDDDGSFRNPIAAALASMEGRPFSDGSLMASYLRAVACAGFTFSGVADRLGIPAWVSASYTEFALERLWRVYRVEPKARVIREVA